MLRHDRVTLRMTSRPSRAAIISAMTKTGVVGLDMSRSRGSKVWGRHGHPLVPYRVGTVRDQTRAS
jgi:hypothetical protein